MSGTLSPAFGAWSSLIFFESSFCPFDGTIPPELSGWTSIQVVMWTRNLLRGTLPPELSTWTTIEVLDISDCDLTGTIPPEYANWTSLKRFDVSLNRLSGTLPPELSSWTSIEFFNIDSNSFSGTIPPDYASWTSIYQFNVRFCQLSGTLPSSLSAWSSLMSLDVTMNEFTGPIPPEFKNWTSLSELVMGGNYFNGTLPSELGQLTLLSNIDFNDNKLGGTLPPELGALSLLEDLDLSSNSLTGTIPPSLGRCSSLRTMSLSGASFYGDVPEELAALPDLESLSLGGQSEYSCCSLARITVGVTDAHSIACVCGSALTDDSTICLAQLNKTCGSSTSCSECTMDPLCGWCGASPSDGVCLPGSDSSSCKPGACESTWHYETCPAALAKKKLSPHAITGIVLASLLAFLLLVTLVRFRRQTIRLTQRAIRVLLFDWGRMLLELADIISDYFAFRSVMQSDGSSAYQAAYLAVFILALAVSGASLSMHIWFYFQRIGMQHTVVGRGLSVLKSSLSQALLAENDKAKLSSTELSERGIAASNDGRNEKSDVHGRDSVVGFLQKSEMWSNERISLVMSLCLVCAEDIPMIVLNTILDWNSKSANASTALRWSTNISCLMIGLKIATLQKLLQLHHVI
eukprot:TRINITY_DN5709_c0_g1::TRINITY_DN5709_c0_g1_i1::g.14543::m.14543 TRINITY_DN5709_c0_g1::TRINITY_DN5709_c0_g1_i1::g.14543  ORF type:complete len:633 (+),score=51.98,sp/Q8VZG8/MIK2_ARATH/32.03/9e-42,sp/Q8VZG8/MIK2_ARATH/28.22/5e-31,sp/Q8VZG8/MIK2_ARATH/28.90/6e-31,sp/Q8VZG8/MIK2_ARATH/28.52/3e-30,sp/Q8VZG8/MIK2_ARATH/27.14/3e-28,sp/Q8VZG8/MIK2_ARATH/28.40/1e-26,sp/Q8VZG8/MIK2_ARATH/28.83/3e-26,sp/Q8VZG8/MIK2_ARATH/27.69/7e-10,LRR_4/PF12799.2/2.5e+03,LRR_4/PF12799.2/0.0044,LRR_4/PF12799.2/0.021,LRR_4